MNCPGQPALAAGLDRKSSSYADRGTAAHTVLEWCLKKGCDADRYEGSSIFVQGCATGSIVMTTEDVEAVQTALDWIREEVFAEGDEFETEVRLRYSDDYWGTSDVVRYRPSTGELLIVDYKHGSGVAVDATDNPQGIGYGLMKAKMLGNRGVSVVRFVIIQPRCFHQDGPIREFVVDGVDMLDWEDRIGAAIAATRKPDAPLVAGSHCRWCPAAGICPGAKAAAIDDVTKTFAPAAYDPAELADTLGRLDAIEGWVKAVREFAYGEAERGVKIPGWKLAPKRPIRRWKDEADARDAMTTWGFDDADLFERKLRSPAQLEELLEPMMGDRTKKARLAAAKTSLSVYVEAISSGHTLVPESDSRPPLRGDVTDDFAAVA